MTAKPPTGPEPAAKGTDPEERLLSNIRTNLTELQKLLDSAAEYLSDPKDARLVGVPFSAIHRRWQKLIKKGFTALQDLMPDRPITEPFRTMFDQAIEMNYDLTREGIQATRDRLTEALTHAFFLLAVACRKGREPEDQPKEADEGWEFLLKIYGLR
jgi:hypothetical protein